MRNYGGRGSGIDIFVHLETKRILQFDEPHPNMSYVYQEKDDTISKRYR